MDVKHLAQLLSVEIQASCFSSWIRRVRRSSKGSSAARLPPAILTIVGRIDGRQVQLFRYVGDEPRQVPFGKPLLQ
jgi:hypothetical protein